MLNAGSDWQRTDERARLLIHSLLAAGHIVQCVYFSGQSVQVLIPDASRWRRWATLKKDIPSGLLVCASQSRRAGLAEDAQAPVRVQSMTPWLECMRTADRVVELV